MDEITSPEDVDALSVIAHCGTAVLATAHGSDLEALFRRPLYQPLLQQRIFQTVVSIRRTEGRAKLRCGKRPHAALDRRRLCVITGSAVVGLQMVAQRRKRLEEWSKCLPPAG